MNEQVSFAENEGTATTHPPALRQKKALGSRTKSIVLTPDKKLMTALLRCYLFFEGCCHNGWNHVNNVYFVVLVGWTPFKVRKGECVEYSRWQSQLLPFDVRWA